MTELRSYRFARGIRLRREPDGSAILLIPEGIVTLNETAAAALELADGTHESEAIAASLAERFDDPDGTLVADVRNLLDEFASRGYLTQ